MGPLNPQAFKSRMLDQAIENLKHKLLKGGNSMNPAHIEGIETINTGGNMMVDLVTLKSGQVVGIGDDFIVLYEDMKDAISGEDKDREIIYT